VREHGLTYGRFIDGLNKAGIDIDRKVLAELAVTDADGFKALAQQAAAAVKKAAARALCRPLMSSGACPRPTVRLAPTCRVFRCCSSVQT
jgi:hypothetical protein